MPTVPSWYEDDESWDTLWLDGERLPGLVTVDISSKRSWDVKKAKGKAKAALTDTGDEPARPKLTWVFDPDEHWSEVVAFLAILNPRRVDAAKKPLEVVHPALELHGVRTIVVEQIDGPKVDRGLGTISIQAIEWIPKPPAVKAGSGTGAPASLYAQIANLDAQMQYLAQQIEDLAMRAQAGDASAAAALGQLQGQREQIGMQRDQLMQQARRPSSGASGVGP